MSKIKNVPCSGVALLIPTLLRCKLSRSPTFGTEKCVPLGYQTWQWKIQNTMSFEWENQLKTDKCGHVWLFDSRTLIPSGRASFHLFRLQNSTGNEVSDSKENWFLIHFFYLLRCATGTFQHCAKPSVIPLFLLVDGGVHSGSSLPTAKCI